MNCAKALSSEGSGWAPHSRYLVFGWPAMVRAWVEIQANRIVAGWVTLPGCSFEAGEPTP
jgi:hypothetical protein